MNFNEIAALDKTDPLALSVTNLRYLQTPFT